MECTLRDGSYAIDYQFTVEDTALIARALQDAGVEYIEVGHGLGFNASPRYGAAAATDEEYLAAAASVLTKAKFGMFCIPGIARLEDLEMAARHGMGFVRVGTNVTEAEQAEPFIRRAKELGMFVSSNLMKSYALPIDGFIEKAKKVAQFGADVVAVVDSAGGMSPEEVHAYVSRLKNEVGGVQVGFHGHNNLLLAVANTIEAAKAGATFLDATLQGMGRSVGNAQTEVLVILLEKMGYRTGIDLLKIMDLGDKVVRPMMGGEKGIDSLSAILGHAQFHSSDLPIIFGMAKKYNLDPRQLVVSVSEIDRVRVTEELAEKVAQTIASKQHNTVPVQPSWPTDMFDPNIFDKSSKRSLEETATFIARELFSLSKKIGKQTIFTIAGGPDMRKQEAAFPFIRQNAMYIIGNAEVATIDQAIQIAKTIDGFVDYIAVDVDHSRGPLSGMVQSVNAVVAKSRVLTYKDHDALVSAVDAFIGQMLKVTPDTHIAIVGNIRVAAKLQSRLEDRGFCVTRITFPAELQEAVNVIVGLTHFESVVDHTILRHLKGGGMLIDAGPGSLFSETVEECHRRGIPVFRVDMRAGLSGGLMTSLETDELVHTIMGRTTIGGVDVVAGGVLGRRGDIVVDAIHRPTKIIGVADGRGHLLSENAVEPYRASIKIVQSELTKMRFV